LKGERTRSKISYRDDHVNDSAIKVQDIVLHEKKKNWSVKTNERKQEDYHFKDYVSEK
jgi:hypothetical protein